MSRKLLLSGLSPETLAWHDALPEGTRSATFDALVLAYLALPEAERAKFCRLPSSRDKVTDAQIAAAIESAGGNKAAAARALGIHYDTIMARTRKKV